VTAIDALQREVSDLERDIDPAEATRLEDRHRALGPEVEGEGAGRRQMRELLAKQLDLMRGLTARLETARARREQITGSMQGVWRAVADWDERRTSEQEARVHAACDHADALLGGPEAAGSQHGVSITTLPTLDR
jgi:hypothetical protein